MRVDALDQGIRQALANRQRAPFGKRFFRRRIGAPETLGQRDQPFGRIVTAVEDNVLAGLAKLRIDGVVDVDLARIHDPHVHPRGDRVVEEHAVHRPAHRLVAAERKTEVRQAAADVGSGAPAADLARSLDEVDRIAAMFVDPGRNGEDVGIEDDVARVGAVGDEQFVRPLANRDFALDRVRLADFVERHDDDCGAIVPALAHKLEERPLAFLHRDRIDDGLARHALEARLDHAPLGAVDHHRHARDVRLGGDALQEDRHRLL